MLEKLSGQWRTKKKMIEEINLDNKENIERIHVHTGLSHKNIKLTYIDNKKKDKSGMLRALSLGSMCMEKDITTQELEIALEDAKKYRELHGIG